MQFKRTGLVLLLAVLFLMTIPLSEAKDSPDAILNSLPSEIKDYVAEAPFTYPEKELGTSIGYNCAGRGVITVYIYDLNTQNIEDGVTSEVVRRSKDMAMRDIEVLQQRGMYRNLKIVTDNPVRLRLADGSMLETFFVSYTYDTVATHGSSLDPVVSDLYVVGLKGYICKIRATRRSYVTAQEVSGVIEAIFSCIKKPCDAGK